MGKELSTRVRHYFENREYQSIPTDSPNVAMYGIYDKNNLYLINVIDVYNGYGIDAERYLEYKAITMQQFSNQRADKIILLNIIISEEASDLSNMFNYVPDMTERFIDVLWFVDVREEKLVIPPKQLKSVLGLQKDIKKLVMNEETTYYKIERASSWPIITTFIFIVNVLMWVYTEYKGSSTNGETLLAMGALYRPYVVNRHEYYRLFTSMFLHIGFTHLLHNMFGLYIFGYRLEQYLKRWQFVIVFLGTGLAGSILSFIVSVAANQSPIAAGASGAVYGLMGSLVVISKILKRPIDGVNSYVIIIMFILGIVHSVITPGVDVICHIGGFASGIALTYLLLKASKRSDLQEEGYNNEETTDQEPLGRV